MRMHRSWLSWTLPFVVLGLPAKAIGGDVPGGLKALRDFYQSVESVQLYATVEVGIVKPLFEGHVAPIDGNGTFVHEESGKGFRTSVRVDPRLQLLEGFDVAYDGTSYQLYMPASKTLALEDAKFSDDGLIEVPVPMPNPFYLPVAFLAPSDDLCRTCQLTLEYLRQPARWRRVLGRDGKAIRSGAGGSRNGEIYEFAVRLAPHGNVASIERRRSDGKVISNIEFSDYRPVGETSLEFPRRILMRDWAPDAALGEQLLSTIDYRIESIEVNKALDESTFVLNPKGVLARWNRGVSQGVPAN